MMESSIMIISLPLRRSLMGFGLDPIFLLGACQKRNQFDIISIKIVVALGVNITAIVSRYGLVMSEIQPA
jgi:hypothetical protein